MALSPDPAGVGYSVTPARNRAAMSGNSLAVASMLTWAAAFPAAEFLLQSWPPLTLIVARIALAVGVLLPLWILVDGPSIVLRARWAKALRVGGLGFGLGTYLLLVAQKLTDPVTVALIASCAPLVGAVLELSAGTRRLRWNFGLGVLASILGGLIATSALAPAQLGLGAVCAIVSTAVFCWASMATVRDFSDLSQIGRTAITLTGGLGAMSVLLGATVLLGFDIRPSLPFDGQQAGMLFMYAVIGMALSQVLFVASISRLGVALASFHVNIAPFYVMVIMAMLGDDWNWTRAAGAAIVALGVVLAQDRSSGKARRA